MLINCAVYKNGRKVADIPVKDISKYVSSSDCFVWVALFEPSPEDLDALATEFSLHPLAVEDTKAGFDTPRLEEYDDSLFAVMQTIEYATSEEDELRVGELAVFVGTDYVLTVRLNTEKGFAEVRARTEREPELLRLGPGYVLYALMDTVVDRYFPVLTALERELESIEDRIFTKSAARLNIEALYALKRKLVTLKHGVESLSQATGRLFGGRVPKVCTGLGDYFRDIAEHLQRLERSIGGLLDMLATAIQVNLGMINLNATEVTKKLAAWGAIIAVPTMSGGVYGMNFENMPELKWTFGYPLALGAMLFIDVALYFWFRRIEWL